MFSLIETTHTRTHDVSSPYFLTFVFQDGALYKPFSEQGGTLVPVAIRNSRLSVGNAGAIVGISLGQRGGG